MKKIKLYPWAELEQRVPVQAVVEGTDLMIIRYGEEVSVLYGRCLHRGVLLANGVIVGKKVVCNWHGWEFRYDTGESGQRCPALKKFKAWIEEGYLWVDADEVVSWSEQNPEPYQV